ncbi:hypothetical protein C8R47DRAFT_1069265 [Mycena vitilis]|nr:hypothetical protein C8R47DRAFT_1069240 [Mycena vitilis]KAJ6497225.1 hypothetical protein C8R47DRAFT_1069265 [Mycena vitilis]
MIAFTISTNLTTAALLIFTTSAVIGLGTLFTQFPALIRLWLAHRCDYAAENRIEVDEVRFRRYTQDSFGLVLAFWGLLDRTEAVLSRLSGRYDSETQIIILTEALDERKSETSRLLSNIEDTMDAWAQQNKANSQKQEAQNKLLQAQMKRGENLRGVIVWMATMVLGLMAGALMVLFTIMAILCSNMHFLPAYSPGNLAAQSAPELVRECSTG